MVNIKPFWVVMALLCHPLARILSLGLFFLGMTLLSGCAQKTTVSEANTYLQAQSLQTEINSYKTQLQIMKARLTETLPQFQEANPSLPPSQLTALTAYLLDNDCTVGKPADKDYCYRLTRVRLIEVTNDLDKAYSDDWAAKKTIRQLIDNINTIVEGLDAKPNPFQPPS